MGKCQICSGDHYAPDCPRPDDPWEPLDAERHRYYGVFGSEDYSARPLAIFLNEEDAVEWAGEDLGSLCIMAIRNLSGEAWNSIEPEPALVAERKA